MENEFMSVFIEVTKKKAGLEVRRSQKRLAS